MAQTSGLTDEEMLVSLFVRGVHKNQIYDLLSRNINTETLHNLVETAAVPFCYDPEMDDEQCDCGHMYYRHFDTYDSMMATGPTKGTAECQ